MFFMLLAHARARVSERTFVIKVMTLDDDVIDDDARACVDARTHHPEPPGRGPGHQQLARDA